MVRDTLTLAPTLALALALTPEQGERRSALSLFLELRMVAGVPATHTDGSLCVLRRHHARTTIVNKDATTYAKFAADGSADAVAARV